MSGRSQYKQIQGASNKFHGKFEYEQLENQIEDKAGVRCSVFIKGGSIILRTKDLADYYLAKAAIRQTTSKEIIRDLQDL